MEDIRNAISQEEFDYCRSIIESLSKYYGERIIGQKDLMEAILIALVADGHILIESVPGLAKTTAVKTISDAVNGKFSRIQCTPDLLPGDIIGTQIYNQQSGAFDTMFGPVFANFVLLDEVNRSSAKTQSAMLEAMQERQVTIGGKTYRMPEDIFIVMATQNPIEQEGTYPLSEAQTDRFMIKVVISYLNAEEESSLLDLFESGNMMKKEQLCSITDIDRVQKIASKVYVDKSIKNYIAMISDATRRTNEVLPNDLGQYVRVGASPRASIAFMQCSKARALLMGRTYVTPDDIKAIAHKVLRHRIGLSYAAIADDITVEQIIDEIMKVVPTP